MKTILKLATTALALILLIYGVLEANNRSQDQAASMNVDYDIILYLALDQYPQTAAHIEQAIKEGESAVCTINREEAESNRNESLRGIPTKQGYDRDEWPMAMCEEGGEGADIRYVNPSDNRGAGSWVSQQLENYSNGTRVLFIVDGKKSGIVSSQSALASESSASSSEQPDAAEQQNHVIYANCAAAREAGAAPVYAGDPGYSVDLDGDKDGVACEK